MALLNAPLTFAAGPGNVIDDLEALTRKALDAQLAQFNAKLDATMYEDALTYLLVDQAWERIIPRYDPARGISLATYVYRLLRLRVTDWFRSRCGTNPHPESVTIDAAVGELDRMAESVAPGEGDPGFDCDPTLERVLREGRRLGLSALDLLAPGLPARAAAGNG